MYMLDTDICIYVLKSRDTALRNKFKANRNLAISSIVYGELCFGIENGDPGLRSQRYEQLRRFLRKIHIEPWGQKEGMEYGQLRARLKQTGMLIGNNDLLIAAHAISCEATLVTNNQREFSRITGLICENWLEMS
jgi:tRNA(fMet)-specific endonuclease VapC